MYKLTALTFALLFLVVFAEAQDSSSGKIISRFELVGGPSFSSNTGYLSNYESRVGGSFGVGYYQKLYRSFSLNVRALHELKGSVGNYPLGTSDGNGNVVEVNDEYSTRFSYLTLYLMPALQLGKNKNIYVSAGGYYSFLHKLSVTKVSTNSETGELIEETTTNDKNYFDPKFDAGVTFQLGYAFKVSNKCQMMLQVFANRGLVDLHNDTFGSQRNNTYGILLSLRMR